MSLATPAAQPEVSVLVPASTPRLEVTVRFLHLTERVVGEFVPPLADWPDGAEPPFRLAQELRVGDQVFRPWQEAEERQIELAGVALGEILKRPLRQPFRFPGRMRG